MLLPIITSGTLLKAIILIDSPRKWCRWGPAICENICLDTGFHIRFQKRLPYRANSSISRLPDKIVWLPDIVNVKTYISTFGCPVGQEGANFWLPDRKKWLPRATGYVKPCDICVFVPFVSNKKSEKRTFINESI